MTLGDKIAIDSAYHSAISTPIDNKMSSSTEDTVTDSTISSPRDDNMEPIDIERSITFNPMVEVVLVPTRRESKDLLDELYWRSEDYSSFKQEAWSEIKEHYRLTGDSPKISAAKLYQPSSEDSGSSKRTPSPLTLKLPQLQSHSSSDHLFGGQMISIHDYETCLLSESPPGYFESFLKSRSSSADSVDSEDMPTPPVYMTLPNIMKGLNTFPSFYETNADTDNESVSPHEANEEGDRE